MKSTACRQQTAAHSSSSSGEDISLGADHDNASAPPCDASSSTAVSQCKSGVPSRQGQFTRKYQAQWKDDLSM